MDAGDDQDGHATSNVFIYLSFFLVGVGGGLPRGTVSIVLIYSCRGAVTKKKNTSVCALMVLIAQVV